MTATEYQKAGFAIFGNNWHAKMAEFLGVSTSTSRHYATLRQQIPDRVAERVRAELREEK